MKSLNKALEDGNAEECHSLLMKPEALLPAVLNRSAYLYYNELNKEKKKKQQVRICSPRFDAFQRCGKENEVNKLNIKDKGFTVLKMLDKLCMRR